MSRQFDDARDAFEKRTVRRDQRLSDNEEVAYAEGFNDGIKAVEALPTTHVMGQSSNRLVSLDAAAELKTEV
jgi:hypothetical protein